MTFTKFVLLIVTLASLGLFLTTWFAIKNESIIRYGNNSYSCQRLNDENP